MPNTGAGGTHNDLSGALPELIDAEAQLYAYATGTLGIDYRVADYGAVRTEADTNLILKYRQDDYNAAVAKDPSVAHIPLQTFRRIAPYGSSYHNYGAAFDVLIVDKGPFPSAAAALQALKASAPSFGLSSAVANDPPHFELATTISDVQQRWADFTGGEDGSVTVRTTGTADAAALVAVAVLGAVLFALRYFRR